MNWRGKRKLKVNWTSYEFIWVASNDPRLEGNAGVTSFWEQRVYLNRDMHEDQLVDTLLHEAFHVAVDHSGLRQLLTPEQQEMIVASLTPQVLGMLHKNPWFVKAIMKDK